MDISFITEYAMPSIVAICLCVGYILKNLVPSEKLNKYIPLIMGALGVVIATWMQNAFTPDVILTGLVSGLASTGLYEAFKNLIAK